MSSIGLAGAISGFLAFAGVVYSTFMQSRGQDKAGRLDGERLGHDELVDALEAQRRRIADLEVRTNLAEGRERECNAKMFRLERQVSNLLLAMEDRE